MRTFGITLLFYGLALTPQTPSAAYTLMPHDRWGSQPLGGPVRYPRLAALARISGEVITAVVINKEGKVHQIKSLTGPSQLRPTAEALVQSLTFKLTVEDGEGPWLFFVTSRFNLNSHDVYCFSTLKDKIPLEAIQTFPGLGPAAQAS